MALKRLSRVLLFFLAFGFVVIPTQSCGPFFESAVFSFQDQPDGRDQDFAAGKLGILVPTFRKPYLAVAYGYLSGATLSTEQQRAVRDIWQRQLRPEQPKVEDEVAKWSKVRAGIRDLPVEPAISPYARVGDDQPYFEFVNCGPDAFDNAARTLQDRMAKFGPTSAELKEWVTGQDQVFENCSQNAPVIPTKIESGPALLKADRDYQIAAAYFYALDFDKAVAGFDSIAQDTSSPWAEISPYLAARALVRKANLLSQDPETFDEATMLAAQRRVERIVRDAPAAAIYKPAVALLNYIRFRTEPAKRVAELDDSIFKRSADPGFKQEFCDYTLLLSQGKRGKDPSDWVQAFNDLGHIQASPPGAQAAIEQHALGRWRETKSVPWLIMALAGSRFDDADARSLIADAHEVTDSSAAYLSVRYYALRLMISQGEADAARKEIDLLLSRPNIPGGARNLLNEERLRVTDSFDDFLQHATESPIPSQLDFGREETVPADNPSGDVPKPLFSYQAAEVFRKRLTLEMLVNAAQSQFLPENVRTELARSAWTRSVLVGDLGTAVKLQPALHDLDQTLWESMAPFRAATSKTERNFAALLVILMNPGLHPSARGGLLRATEVYALDDYRDNWWCTDVSGGPTWEARYSQYDKTINLKFVDPDPAFSFPTWMKNAEKTEVLSEWRRLSGVGTAPNWLTQQVLDYAKQHPGDEKVPMALSLAVRATHFGCVNIETTKFSKEAFELLHSRYPKSAGAADTPYYY